MAEQYEDIIGLPHHVSATRPQMSAHDRAAQFSPFAALTGYEAAVDETARLTDSRVELDESRRELLGRRLLALSQRAGEPLEAVFTCFVPDEKKDGGAYETVTGCIKRLDEHEGRLVLTDGRSIPLGDIYDVECDALRQLEP